MLKFKLVTKDRKTRVDYDNEMVWEIGQRVEAVGDRDQGLCSDERLHCYDSPELAALRNPMYDGIKNPRMMAVKVEGIGKSDHGLNVGYLAVTPVLFMDCPVYGAEQEARAVHAAIHAAHTGTEIDLEAVFATSDDEIQNVRMSTKILKLVLGFLNE